MTNIITTTLTAISVIIGVLFFTSLPVKAEDFTPACIEDPKGHDYKLTLNRYQTNELGFLTKRLQFDHMQKLINFWNEHPEHGDLNLAQWNMMQVIITPEFAFAVRGKRIGEYVPICFTMRLTDDQVVSLFGQTPAQMFENATDL